MPDTHEDTEERGERLEAALDGLSDATNYAEEVGLMDLSIEIGRCYQRLGGAAPVEDWDELPDRGYDFPDTNEEIEWSLWEEEVDED